MKNLILMVCLFLSSSCLAQSIDINWMFSKGDSSIIKSMEYDTIIDPGPDGIDVVWDFSLIETDSTLADYSALYGDAKDFGLNSFSEITTLAVLDRRSSIRFKYFDLVNDDLLLYGDSFPSGTKLIYDPPIVQFSFPMELNQEVNSFTIGSFYNLNGEVAFDNYIEIYRKLDGIGTLITPNDTFYNCIRINEELVINPLSTTPDVYETNSYYYNNLSNEMAQVYTVHHWSVSNFSWQTNVNNNTTSSQETSKDKPSIHYEGNSGFLVKNIDGPYSISVFDKLGRQFENKTIEFNKSGTQFYLDGSYQSPNVLFILFVNTKTNDFYTHKFVP